MPTGQAYVASQPPVATDDYFTSGAVVVGGRKMYTIQCNHRVAMVYANDVTATTPGRTPGTDVPPTPWLTRPTRGSGRVARW
ncbi:hypothetical protein QZN11_00535 [Streptomyces gramineus]|uniref:hypothetical protein n=1 Tax=Streptomyces gramineus TaxID=910542 RepID=UPI00398B0D71